MRRALLLLLFVAAPALAEPLPSPVVFPPQRLPISFSHARHLKIEGVGCGTCHEDAAHSRLAADDNLPKPAACAPCHPPDYAATADLARVVVPPPNLKFNHEVHVQRGARCVSCHEVERVNLATRAQLPRMPSCLGCHDNKTAPAACATCHIADAQGRIATGFPQGQLIPSGTLRGDAHDLRFRLDHARVAKNDERYCASCHARKFCTDCHDGTVKPLDFHGNDYVSLHALDARRATTSCTACHREQTFCTGCHARLGVSPDPKTSEYQAPARPFHPDATLDHERDHAVQAQRNLRACASCHRESFCAQSACHGAMVSPHPINWATSLRCKSLLARDGRMCLRCHTNVEEARCD